MVPAPFSHPEPYDSRVLLALFWKSAMKRPLGSLAKLTLGPLLLLGLLRVVGVDTLWRTVQAAHVGWLLLALAGYFATVWLRGYRWRVFLKAQGLTPPLARLIRLDLIGSFFNLVLPSSVGGDVVKFYELAREQPATQEHGEARLASTLLADRICGLLILFVMGAAVAPFAAGQVEPSTIALLVSVALGSVLSLSLLLNRGLRQGAVRSLPGLGWLLQKPGIRGLYASLDRYGGAVLLRAALISLLFNGVMIGINVALALAFGVRLPLPLYLLVVPLISLAQALPLSINGLGVREGAYLYFLGQAGVAQPLALSIGLAYYGCMVLVGLVGGLLYLASSLRALRPQTVRIEREGAGSPASAWGTDSVRALNRLPGSDA